MVVDDISSVVSIHWPLAHHLNYKFHFYVSIMVLIQITFCTKQKTVNIFAVSHFPCSKFYDYLWKAFNQIWSIMFGKGDVQCSLHHGQFFWHISWSYRRLICEWTSLHVIMATIFSVYCGGWHIVRRESYWTRIVITKTRQYNPEDILVT